MKQPAEWKDCYGTLNLLDAMLSIKLNTEEFAANKKIIKNVSKEIDYLKTITEGYSLISIIKDLDRTLLLIIVENKERYKLYSWNIKEKIEKKVEFEQHSRGLDNLREKLYNGVNYYDRHTIISSCIVETLNGYDFNINNGLKLIDFININTQSNITASEAVEKFPITLIGNTIGKNIKNKLIQNVNIIKNLRKKYKDIDVIEKIELDSIASGNLNFCMIELNDVKHLNETRIFKVKYHHYHERETYTHELGETVFKKGYSSSNFNVHQINKIYQFDSYGNDRRFNIEKLQGLPFNLIDKGRIILCIKINGSWEGFISEDPKINPDYKMSFIKDIDEYFKIHSSSMINLHNYHIEDKINGDIYMPTHNNDPLPTKLKTIKNTFDEYKYITKKTAAEGQDIKITDKIMYNHSNGKLIYNDFSIELNDNFTKALLYKSFKDTLLNFYRGDKTEQEILDILITKYFYAIEKRMNSYSREGMDLNIILNNKININLSCKMSVRKNSNSNRGDILGKMFYLNGQRFNKNEVLLVLKEMTCYRDNVDASNFISNIGRLGLSVYIGITTGYEVNVGSVNNPENRIFKFKKLKGRSKYQLILDDTTVPITGKKLINILYSNFIGENPNHFRNKINELIFASSESTYEYIKYKSLIDDTYLKYKENAFNFLKKKVEDLDGTMVKYYNNRSRAILDGVLITGLSGKNYVIAYNAKDSYVFMDPELKEENTYGKGKYICMIDQSNIKSNISYDTVVSKLLALKNDSSIAHTIYNLEEEL